MTSGVIWAFLLMATPASDFPVAYVSQNEDQLLAFDFKGKEVFRTGITPADSLSLDHSSTKVMIRRGSALSMIKLTSGAAERPVTQSGSKAMWAPAGPNLAFLEGDELKIWNSTLPNEPPRTLTKGVRTFSWSPDGFRLAISHEVQRRNRISIFGIEDLKPRIVREDILANQLSWSADGRKIAFTENILGQKGAFRIKIVDLFLRNEEAETGAYPGGELQWSPDSRTLLILSQPPELVQPGVKNSRKRLDKVTGPVFWKSSSSLEFFKQGQIYLQRLAGSAPEQRFSLEGAKKDGSFARTPQIDLDASLLSADPFRDLPKPGAKQKVWQGYVGTLDPLEGTFEFWAESSTSSDGRTLNFSRPQKMAMRVTQDTHPMARPDQTGLRAFDFPVDSPIAVMTPDGEFGQDSRPVLWAYFPDFKFLTSPTLPLLGFPKLEKANPEHDRVIRDKIVVPMVFPAIGKISYQDWFLAPRGGGTRRHLGQDLMGAKMTPMVAVFDGKIYFGRDRGNAGHTVTIVSPSGWRAEYYHVNNDTPGTNDGQGGDDYAFAPGLRSGDSVKAGQFVGYLGNSGNAETTGAHIHFELWYDPLRVVINAFSSLRAARKLQEPVYPDPAPLLRPNDGELRMDGLIRNVNLAERRISFIEIGRTTAGKKGLATTYPTFQNLQLPQGTSIRLRHRSDVEIGLGDITPELFVTVISPKHAPAQPKLVAVERR